MSYNIVILDLDKDKKQNTDITSDTLNIETIARSIFGKYENIQTIENRIWFIDEESKQATIRCTCKDLSKCVKLQSFQYNPLKYVRLARITGDVPILSYYDKNMEIINITDISCTFKDTNIEVVNCSNWDVSHVTDMSLMFGNCYNLRVLNVSNWDVSRVESMYGMFYRCLAIEQLDISTWKTKNVKDMRRMFYDCNKLKSLNVSNFDTSNVEKMLYMFAYCKLLKTIDVSRWNTRNVKSMKSMFAFCESLKYLDISTWDISNVKDMSMMFMSTLFEILIIPQDLYNRYDIDTSYMFEYCKNEDLIDKPACIN